MAPTVFTDVLNDDQKAVLIDTAWRSIRHGLEHGRPLRVPDELRSGRLGEPGASFVTLHADGRLRGCIGSLEAHRPLIDDVADNAFSAAFRDPRFDPLEARELDRLSLEISVLTKPEPLDARSEQDLLRRIEPGRDGLILQDGGHRGTFLPSVWESLPDPALFVRELKRKAGLRPDHWSDRLRVWRYRTESFSG